MPFIAILFYYICNIYLLITYDLHCKCGGENSRVIKMVLSTSLYILCRKNFVTGASEQGQQLIDGLLHVLSCWARQHAAAVTLPATPPIKVVRSSAAYFNKMYIRAEFVYRFFYIIMGSTLEMLRKNVKFRSLAVMYKNGNQVFGYMRESVSMK